MARWVLSQPSEEFSAALAGLAGSCPVPARTAQEVLQNRVEQLLLGVEGGRASHSLPQPVGEVKEVGRDERCLNFSTVNALGFSSLK